MALSRAGSNAGRGWDLVPFLGRAGVVLADLAPFFALGLSPGWARDFTLGRARAPAPWLAAARSSATSSPPLGCWGSSPPTLGWIVA